MAKPNTYDYSLKDIPADLYQAARAKAAAQHPPISFRWVLISQLEKWIGQLPKVTPQCAEEACPESVAYVDNSGAILCGPHATQRRAIRPCRLLKAFELKRLQRGQALGRY